MSRRDDINALYQPSRTLEKACKVLFCANTIISVIAVYAESVISFITIVLVVIAFLYMILSLVDDGVLWFRAERARRKNSFQVAFKVKLDKYETAEYYNNDVKDPELSYAANQFESILFTKEISERMILMAVVKILVALTILIISCRFIPNDHILLIVSQTVFSTVVIEDSVRLIIFTYRIKALYDDAYHEFITVGISSLSQRVWVKFFCVEYESIKAHYRVRLSNALFIKLNPILSDEWKTLSEQIKIYPDEQNHSGI